MDDDELMLGGFMTQVFGILDLDAEHVGEAPRFTEATTIRAMRNLNISPEDLVSRCIEGDNGLMAMEMTKQLEKTRLATIKKIIAERNRLMSKPKKKKKPARRESVKTARKNSVRPPTKSPIKKNRRRPVKARPRPTKAKAGEGTAPPKRAPPPAKMKMKAKAKAKTETAPPPKRVKAPEIRESKARAERHAEVENGMERKRKSYERLQEKKKKQYEDERARLQRIYQAPPVLRKKNNYAEMRNKLSKLAQQPPSQERKQRQVQKHEQVQKQQARRSVSVNPPPAQNLRQKQQKRIVQSVARPAMKQTMVHSFADIRARVVQRIQEQSGGMPVEDARENERFKVPAKAASVPVEPGKRKVVKHKLPVVGNGKSRIPYLR